MSAAPFAEAADELIPAGLSELPRTGRRLLRKPLAVVCLGYLALVVSVSIVAPIVLPEVAHEQAGDLLAVLEGPSWDHPLGTDTLGRDVLNRLLVGTRLTTIAAAQVIAVALPLGVLLGLLAGFAGGWLDRVIGWLVDLKLAMPGLIIVLVVCSIFPGSLLAAMVTLGVLSFPFLTRMVRSAVLPIREELYIAAARVSGLSRSYIIARHVLPRITGMVVVQASLFAAGSVLVTAGLAYLGLIASAEPTWGGMLNDGIEVIVLQPWLIWPPGIVIAVTVLALTLLGDAISDATAETWSAPVRRKRRRRSVEDVTAELEPTRRKRPRRLLAAERAKPQPLPPLAPSRIRPLLSVEGLSVSFPSSSGMVTVVEDVTFEIGPGETVGLVGESGCGKTVTATSILGLVSGEGEITTGRIMFEGRDLAATSEKELRRLRGKEIALISQEPMVSFNPVFQIRTQLVDVLRVHHGMSRRTARRRAVELLETVRLPEPEVVARRYAHELSGGMAQRAAIARALAGEPKLLIADEPTTALDVTVQAEILELLRELQRERQMAVLFVTHDWGVVADLCDRAVVMYAGQVVEQAELRPLFHQPLHPYTEALLSSNPYYLAEAKELPTIPGTVPKPGLWPKGCHFHPRCRYATEACRARPIPLVRPAPGRETRCIHSDRLLPTAATG